MSDLAVCILCIAAFLIIAIVQAASLKKAEYNHDTSVLALEVRAAELDTADKATRANQLNVLLHHANRDQVSRLIDQGITDYLYESQPGIINEDEG